GSSDHTIWLWDLASGKELRRLPVGRSSIRALAFSPNGRLLASVGSEESGNMTMSGVVRLWETATGKELPRLEKHEGRIGDVAFSPDGRTLVTGGTGLRLWEAVTGRERRRIRGHDGDITSVDFSPDGRLLVSSSWSDRTALVWDLTEGARGEQMSAAELHQRWDALAGDDTVKAHQALRALVAMPRQAVGLLRERLRPVSAADPERLTRLIRDL